MTKPVTLRDIAAKAKVSHETVSRALRGDHNVSEQTRERVVKLAQEMGYRANPLIQALMRSRYGERARKATSNVVFLRPIWGQGKAWRGFPFKQQMDGAIDRLRELGFDAEDLPLTEQELNSSRLGEILKARGVLGVIVGSMPPSCRVLELDCSNLAAVGMGLALKSPRIDRVAPDTASGLEMVFDELLARGYRRPGLVIHRSQDERRNHMPCAVWKYQQQETLKAGDRVPIHFTDHQPKGVQDWYRRYKPDVVASYNASHIDFLHEIGLTIPDEVGFVSLEVPDNCRISGVDTQVLKSSQLAAELLANKLLTNSYGIPEQRHTILLDSEWREGTTLRPRV